MKQSMKQSMKQMRVLALFALLFATMSTTVAEAAGSPAPPDKPNIVVFYLDDVAPNDGRLWADPDITPALYDLFVAHGVHFPNAIGETPLCCPGRAGLLTGLHTFNHGVIVNDARLFNPAEHVGKELTAAGYDTMLIGKYFNHSYWMSPAQWTASAAGWTNFDVMRTPADPESGWFYNYSLFTKEGDVSYTNQHSTRTIAERAVARIQSAPSSSPVFALLSLINTHAPHLPMPEFVGDPRCADMAPWKPPNYNEEDVSDKPTYVRNLPLLPEADGWPMVTMCEEMLGVDWLVTQVTDELRADGRFDNTVFVFTADNGMGWGQHRLGEVKQVPYATPVPLYFSWPSQWRGPRSVDDVVSNIDLAPTFCALGGCTLGPYPGGQTKPDGISLKPVLDGSATNTGRGAVLEVSYAKHIWAALRTNASSPLGRWHYIENASGFVELYDPVSDPYELTNRGSDRSLADLRTQLSHRLGQLLQEGRVATDPRPDARIALGASGPFKGTNVYESIPTQKQTQTLLGVLPNTTNDYWVQVVNRGTSSGDFRVGATSTGTALMVVNYLVKGVDVTSQVSAGTYVVTGVAPGASTTVVVRITVAPDAGPRAKRNAILTFTSTNGGLVDVARAVARR